jgi:hypothetical protein
MLHIVSHVAYYVLSHVYAKDGILQDASALCVAYLGQVTLLLLVRSALIEHFYVIPTIEV